MFKHLTPFGAKSFDAHLCTREANMTHLEDSTLGEKTTLLLLQDKDLR